MNIDTLTKMLTFRELIFSVLSFLWKKEWLTQKASPENLKAFGVTAEGLTNSELLGLLRAESSEQVHVHCDPEEEYQHTRTAQTGALHSRMYLLAFFAVLTAGTLFEIFNKNPMVTIVLFIVLVLLYLAWNGSVNEQHLHKITQASRLISNEWAKVRKGYVDTRFVETVVKSLIDDELSGEAQAFLEVKASRKYAQLGDMLRKHFRRHFAVLGIPYIRFFERCRKPEEIYVEYQRLFNLMGSLVPYMGFGEPDGAVRRQAYETALAAIEKTDGPKIELFLVPADWHETVPDSNGPGDPPTDPTPPRTPPAKSAGARRSRRPSSMAA